MNIYGYGNPPNILDIPPSYTTIIDGLEAANAAAIYDFMRSAGTLTGLLWAHVFYSVWTSSIKNSGSEMHALAMATNAAVRLDKILGERPSIQNISLPEISELEKINLHVEISGLSYKISEIYNRGKIASDESALVFAVVLYLVWESLPNHSQTAKALLSAKAALAATDGELSLFYEGKIVSNPYELKQC